MPPLPPLSPMSPEWHAWQSATAVLCIAEDEYLMASGWTSSIYEGEVMWTHKTLSPDNDLCADGAVRLQDSVDRQARVPKLRAV